MSSESSGIFNYTGQDKPVRSSRVPHALAIGASTVIILAGIQAASGLVGPMLLALFLAVILLVPLRWLQSHGCPKLLAFLLVLVCTIVLFVGIMFFISQSLNEEIKKIPGYRDLVVSRYNDLSVQMERQMERWGFSLGEFWEKVVPGRKATHEEPAPPDMPVVPIPPPNGMSPVTVPEPDSIEKTDTPDEVETPESETEEEHPHVTIPSTIPTLSPEEMEEWLRRAAEMGKVPSLIELDPQIVAFWVTRVMLYLRDMLALGFLVLLFTIFMLFEATYFPAKVNRAFGKDGPINIGHFNRIADDLRRYLFLKTLSCVLSGGAAMFVYWMFGVPAFVFWGIVAFFLYYIPNIGGTLAAVIPGALILVLYGVPSLLLYIVCLLIVECSVAYGIEPKLLGHGLRLSTLVIILSLFFWGFLLGPIGLFLAAPLTVMIKIILQAFPETRWIAVFLDGGGEKH